MKSKPFIHPNCPRRLAAAFHFARNRRGEGYKLHVLAEKIGVNVKYLHNMIVKGIEPNDATEKLQAVRKAMFLSARKRKPRDASTAGKPGAVTLPEYKKWWQKLKKEDRDQWIKRTHSAKLHTDEAQGSYTINKYKP